MPIEAYKQSWSDNLFDKERKRSKKKETVRKGKPVETAAAVEITKDAGIFFMISTAA